jgi:hypothetical protein
MSISIRTNKSAKVTTPMIPEGFNNGLGMRNQIKRENRGIHTSRKDSVFSTNDHNLQAQRRIDIVGDGYGSGFRVEGQTRGVDFMRTVDYVGSAKGGSTSGIGNPLGQVPTVSRLVNAEAITRESIRGADAEGENRQSVYNISAGGTQKNKYLFATPEQSRGVTIADSSAVHDESVILKVTTKPTKTYTTVVGQVSIHESTPFTFRTDMIKENNLVVDGKSGNNTLSKFEKYKAHSGTSVKLSNRVMVNARARETYQPVYEKEHDIKVLPSKVYASVGSGKQYKPKYDTVHELKQLNSTIKATDVVSAKSDPVIRKNIKADVGIQLKQTRKIAEFKVTPKITRNKPTEREPYVIKNPRLRLDSFTMNSGAKIPKF